jgi:hypothetical protein
VTAIDIVFVGGKLDERTGTIPVPFEGVAYEGELYRRTNVFVPPRHDEGGIRRRVYLVATDRRADEEILDLLDDGKYGGGESGGA